MSPRVAPSVLAALVLVLSAPDPAGRRNPGQAGPTLTDISQRLLGVRTEQPNRDFGRGPVFFVPNLGQIDRRVVFYAQGRDRTVYFAPDGLTIALDYARGTEAKGPAARWAVKVDFPGARKGVRPEGLKENGGIVSFFQGKPEEWRTGLPAYSEIIYRDLWPGIDLIYKGEKDLLKYEFVVDPGADPSMIRIAYQGTTAVVLTAEGGLTVETPAGNFGDDAPIAYQEINGRRESVAVAYALAAAEAGSETRTIVFKTGSYDRSRTIVLDPVVLISCGYIGGASPDVCEAVAVDASGNVYVTGETQGGAAFPVTAGPDLTGNGGADAFIAKIPESGTGLVYCGYIGGSANEYGNCIAVDTAGNAYVAGGTNSSETTFPVTGGPDLTHGSGGGGLDGFIAKVNPEGTALVYCGYIGGNKLDIANGIAIDASGRAYVAGYTYGSDFPVLVGPDLSFNGGESDAFIARISASGTAFEYCGYIGGSGDDNAEAIAIDASGNAYVAGGTASADFPAAVGPDLTPDGDSDAWVAKVNPSGTIIERCGFIGGSAYDTARAIAIDPSGAVYVAGDTGSTETSFPVTGGPDPTYNGGTSIYGGDLFVAKIDPSGAGLVYCGYVGGSGNDWVSGIAVDGAGRAFVCGTTDSPEASFPVINGPDLTYNGGSEDAFAAAISADGATLVYCGYIGGSEGDEAHGLALDEWGTVLVVGATMSGQATFPVAVGPDLTHNGGWDGFVARVSAGVAGPTLASLNPSSGTAGDPGFFLSVAGTGFEDGAVVRWDGTNRPTTFVSGSEVRAQIAAADVAAGKTVSVTVINPNGGISNGLTFSISNPVPVLASLSTTQVTGGGAGFSLNVLGSNFVPNSIVRWNGNDRATAYISRTEVQAAVLATDIAAGGEAQVTVFNPAPAGGASAGQAVHISSFTLGSSPASITVAAGQTATYTITATPQNGPFDAAVAFSCQGLPSKCTAAFAPASLTPGTSAVTTTLTLTTVASAKSGAAAASLTGIRGFVPPLAGLAVLGVILLLTGAGRRPASWPFSRRRLAAYALILLAAILVGSCSSGGNNPPPYTGTPKGTHQISVQGTSGNMTIPTVVTLVVN